MIDEQTKIWELLFEKTRECLREFGREDFPGRGDYWVLDDNYGFQSINVAIHQLAMLRPQVVRRLQGLLRGHTGWEIKVAVDVPGKENLWPEMGIIVRPDEIIDELDRSYLPDEFRAMSFRISGV